MFYIFVLRFKRRLYFFGFYRFFYWDVNNENLYGDFFECYMMDLDIIYKMFQWIYFIDFSIKFFFNDYLVFLVFIMIMVGINILCLFKVNW